MIHMILATYPSTTFPKGAPNVPIWEPPFKVLEQKGLVSSVPSVATPAPPSNISPHTPAVTGLLHAEPLSKRRKICSFCFPPLFSLAIVLLQKNVKKERPMSQNKGFLWIPQQIFFKGAYFGRKFPVRFDLPRSKALSLIGKLRKPARWRNEVKPIHPLLWCYQLKVIYWIYS